MQQHIAHKPTLTLEHRYTLVFREKRGECDAQQLQQARRAKSYKHIYNRQSRSVNAVNADRASFKSPDINVQYDFFVDLDFVERASHQYFSEADSIAQHRESTGTSGSRCCPGPAAEQRLWRTTRAGDALIRHYQYHFCNAIVSPRKHPGRAVVVLKVHQFHRRRRCRPLLPRSGGGTIVYSRPPSVPPLALVALGEDPMRNRKTI